MLFKKLAFPKLLLEITSHYNNCVKPFSAFTGMYKCLRKIIIVTCSLQRLAVTIHRFKLNLVESKLMHYLSTLQIAITIFIRKTLKALYIM